MVKVKRPRLADEIVDTEAELLELARALS